MTIVTPDEDMATLFKEYAGQEATVTNIEQAFSVGTLILSQSLKEILKRRSEEKKKAAESVCTKGIGGKRLHRSTNITYRESISIVPDKAGVLRSDLCRNEGVKGGKCTICRGMYANMHRYLDCLEEPDICPPVNNDEGMPNENREVITLAALSDKIDRRVLVLTSRGKKQSLNEDQMLAEYAALLDAKGEFMTELGDHKSFCICSCCKTFRVVVKQTDNSAVCAKYKNKQTSEAWQQKGKESNSEKRISLSSRCTWTKLSNSELSALAERLNSKRTIRETKIKLMEGKIKEFEEDTEIQDETLQMMSDALDKCKKNPEDVRSSLEVCFEEMTNAKVKDGTDSDSLLSSKETQNLIDFIVEAMKNHTIKLVGDNLWPFPQIVRDRCT